MNEGDTIYVVSKHIVTKVHDSYVLLDGGHTILDSSWYDPEDQDQLKTLYAHGGY